MFSDHRRGSFNQVTPTSCTSLRKVHFFPYQELREVSKARRNQLSSRSIAAMKAADQSCSILAPSFSGAHRKFTAEEFVSLFLTKPKRECSCGEDKDGAVLAISCVNHAQWRARRAGRDSKPTASILSRFSGNRRKFTAQEFSSQF